jgi:hypothetical protein
MSQLTDQRVVAAFVEFADTLVADFDVLDFLHLLSLRCTELFDVAAAGVLLADQQGGLRVMGASSEEVQLLELFQLQNEQGPCLECFRNGHPVAVADLAAAGDRWPRFAAEAHARGFAAVQAIPMRLREKTIRALNQFNTTPGDVLADTEVVQALADVATIGLLQQRAHGHSDNVITQLQEALNSRVIIEQAKGVLAERAGLNMDQAFTAMRTYARAHQRRLSDLAHAVVHRTEDLPGLAETSPRQ